ncbi:hypothetical protein [Plantactinospora sp. CA-290183]|uniref:hypothetical protein n=1 Tax=Plantactinospora sp. CA-290183 TaxID=3240006 RepID=UPI003D8A8A18
MIRGAEPNPDGADRPLWYTRTDRTAAKPVSSARPGGGGIDPHTPRRPLWLCRTCAVDWPCLAARSLLSVDFVTDPTGLAVYLAAQLQDALADLTALNPDPGPDPAALHARFLAWVRPRVAITRARLDGGTPPPASVTRGGLDKG